ncbi:hypothetical protein [Paraburkholderia sp. 22B1P]|uniref:hypothetical protein n=1 Tax=Paraburkholderia sp. 22B1P TaxID=3080498 RepID=UPI003092A413|nr:ASCH domain-containing protein [Paraburkholderia sp. 22B1P]
MKERPILFSGPMVRALLDGRKMQTRRVVKHQPPEYTRDVITFHHPDPRTHYWAFDGGSLMDWAQPCPYGEVGDHLYVRETWQHSNYPLGPYDADCIVFYRADYLDDPHGPDGEKSPEGKYRDWRPSIHMPRAASRITLEVTGVRVERLQDISAADARAEGIEYREDYIAGSRCRRWRAYGSDDGWFPEGVDIAPIHSFQSLWNSLNAERGLGWPANPWVWVVEFKRIEK